MAFQTHYETRYDWSGSGDDGTAAGDELAPLPVGTPSSGQGRWNPEVLLLSAVETCLFNTFAYIAAMSKLSFRSYRSTASGDVELVPREGYRFARITVRPVIIVSGKDVARAQRILEKAHEACLVSRSVTFPVAVEPTIVEE